MLIVYPGCDRIDSQRYNAFFIGGGSLERSGPRGQTWEHWAWWDGSKFETLGLGNPKLCMIIDYEPSRQEMSGTCFRRFGVSKSWPINLLCPHEPCTLPGVSPTAVAPDLSCCSTTVCVALSRSKNVQQPQWHPKTSYQAQPQVFLQRVGAIHFIVNQLGSSFQDEKV